MFGGVTIGPTLGEEVVVAVVEEPCQLQPLADEAGQPDYGQVEPAPQLAVEGVAVFVQQHTACIVAGVMLKVGLYLHGQPHLHIAAQRHAGVGMFFSVAGGDVGDTAEGVHPVDIAYEHPHLGNGVAEKELRQLPCETCDGLGVGMTAVGVEAVATAEQLPCQPSIAQQCQQGEENYDAFGGKEKPRPYLASRVVAQ